MTTRKRFEITIETEQMLIVRRRYSIRLWCGKCGCETDFVPLEQIVPREQASRLVEVDAKVSESRPASSFHIRETQDGSALVCLDSVMTPWVQAENKARPKPE